MPDAVIRPKIVLPSRLTQTGGLPFAAPVGTNIEQYKESVLEKDLTIAIDPGGTTGIAVRLPDGTIATTTFDTELDLWRFIAGESAPIAGNVILEEWQYFKGVATPAGVYTAGLVSGLRAICYVLRIPLFLRTPGSRKAQMQKAENWLNETKAGKYVVHEVDALAHLFAWERIYNVNGVR